MADDFDPFAVAEQRNIPIAAANVMSSALTAPEKAAESQRAAAVLGVPALAVRADPDFSTQQVAGQTTVQALQGAPATAKWLADDPENAAVTSHKDVPVLANVEQLLSRAWSDVAGGVAGGVAGAVGGLGQAADAVGTLQGDTSGGSSRLLSPITDAYRQAQEIYSRRVANPNLADHLVSTIGSVIPLLAAPEATPTYFAAQGADTAGQENAAAHQSNTPLGAANVLGQATVQGLLGSLPIAHYAEGVVPELGNAAMTALTKLGVGTAAAAAQGVAMQGGSNVVAKATVDPSRDLTAGLTDSAGQMALLHALTRLPSAISEGAIKPPAGVADVTAAADLLHSSPMPGRSPERTQDFLNQVTQGKSVFVPADQVQTYLQSVPPADAQTFLDNTEIAPQLEAATVAGAKVAIPADALMMDKGAFSALADHISLNPGDLSPAEHAAAIEAAPGQIEATGQQVGQEATQAAADLQPQQQVYDDVRSQLKGIGLKDNEARANAAVVAARYATRADRMSTTDAPTDAFQQYQQAAGRGGLQFAEGEAPPAAGTSLEQTGDAAPRGRIDLPTDDSAAIIRLFSQRNKSTIPHELGHAFLEELRADAGQDSAPQQVKDDYAAVATHLGFDGLADHEAIPTDAHEAFARGFERYLLEGKAPSEKLRGTFQRFKDWLTKIYRNVASLNAPIEPIRGVFDRLLATDDEIASTQRRQGYSDALPIADSGMTGAEHAAYMQAVQAAKEAAHEKLMSKAMKDLSRVATKDYQEKRATMRAAVAEEVAERPEMRAHSYLVGREALDGVDPVKLRRSDVEDAIGAEDTKRLPRGREAVYADEGVHPDDVAALTGHATGEEMLRDLLKLGDIQRSAREVGDRASVKDLVIDSETDSHMAAKYGDTLNPDTLQEAAQDAIHSDARAQVLQIEQRALERIAGTDIGPYTTEAIKAYAEGVVGRLRVKEVRPELYLHAERQAARDVQRYLLAGDKVSALGAKRKQLVAFHMFRAAEDAKEELGVMGRRFSRFARRERYESIAQDHFDQISSLLHRFGLRADPPRNDAPPLSSWADQQEMENFSSIIAPSWLRLVGHDVPFSELPMEEARELRDSIASIAHQGREAKTAWINGKREDLAALADEVKAKRDDAKVKDPESGLLNEKRIVHEANASLLQVNTMMRLMDNDDPYGPFQRVMGWGASDGNAAEHELKTSTWSKIDEAYQSAGPEQRQKWARKVAHTELIDPLTGSPYRDLTHANVFALFMHFGTDSNFDKLTRGWSISEASVTDLVHRTLAKEDYDLAEKLWAANESLWPHIVKSEMADKGVQPEKVPGRVVDTPFGPRQGGYWPVDYDPIRNRRLADKQAKTTVEEFARRFAGTSQTRDGFTQGRTDYAGPVSLSVDKTIYQHINDVTKRVAWGEWVKSTMRFLHDPTVERAVVERLGREYHREMVAWVQRSVGYRIMDPRAVQFAENMMRAARTNSVANTTGLNLRIIAEHAGAIPQTVATIGKEATADGYRRYLSNPVMMGNLVLSKSREMPTRMDQLNRDLKDLADDLRNHRDPLADAADKVPVVGGALGASVRAFHSNGLIKAYREFGHVPVAWANMRLVAMPAWVGAYYKALREGHTEEEAVRYGDYAVRVSHPSGASKDLAAIQDPNSEFFRAVTSYISYHNNQFNLASAAASGARQARSHTAMVKSLEAFLMVTLAAPVAGALLSGESPDDWANPASWAKFAGDTSLRGLWAGVPVVRNVADFALSSTEHALGVSERKPELSSLLHTPAESLVGRQAKAAEDLRRIAWSATTGDTSQPPSDKTVRDLISAPGDWLGIGMVQPARMAQELYDIKTGKQTERATPFDIAHDAAFGAPPTRH